MVGQFKSLLFTETGKDTTIVFLGTLANIIAGGLFFIFVPRILGPADYGLFATVVATGLMAVAIANFGLDTGILRFTHKDSANASSVFSIAFKSYLVLGSLVTVISFLTAPLIANFLNYPQITQLLRIAFAGIIFILLTNFFVASLQAKQEFLKAAIVNLSSNVARLILLAVSAYFLTVNLVLLTVLFFFITIVSLVIGKIYLSFKLEPIDRDLSREYFKYNLWIALALIISSVPFDNYFLLKFAGAFQTGLYAAPFKVLTFSYQFGGNFTRVLASRFASFDTNVKAIEFAKKSIVFPSLFASGIIFLGIISPLVAGLFGENYIGSARVLLILSFGFAFFFLSTIPSSMILYYLGKSNISFLITAIRYLVFIFLLIALVPSQKAVGAAIAFSITEVIAFSLMIGYVTLKLLKSKDDKH